MRHSTQRFLTTHTGSLPRPDDLTHTMHAKERGVPVDRVALAARVREAVAEVVKKQTEAGIDLVSDGEMSKPSYATYIKDRLAGFGGTGNTFVYQDLAQFPRLEKRVFGDPGRSRRKTPACNGAISVLDAEAAGTDADSLNAAVEGTAAEALSRCSSVTTTTRTRRPTSMPLPRPCGTNMRPWQRPASFCRSTVRTWAWAAISNTQT